MKTNNGIIRKLGMLALAALIAASAAACKPQNPADQGSTNPPTNAPSVPITGEADSKVTMAPNATPAPIQRLDGYSYQFIRIQYTESANSMTPYVINSVDKLREVAEANPSIGSKSKNGMDDLLKEYDEEFFKKNYILVFNLTFSSGSVIPKVKSVKIEDGVINIVTEGVMEGDVGTTDMASHMCLLALESERFPEASTFNVTGAGTAKGTESKRN